MRPEDHAEGEDDDHAGITPFPSNEVSGNGVFGNLDMEWTRALQFGLVLGEPRLCSWSNHFCFVLQFFPGI